MQQEVTSEKNDIFSVSQISTLIQGTLNKNFSNIRVKGEISSLKRHSSGHIYFDLKDEQGSVLNAICWRGTASKIKIQLEHGLEVIAKGSITTYPQRSNYQIIISDVEVEGVGALMKLLEERRQKLLAEGLFDMERKKPLPFLPQVIGVVTSPTGAVIKDILHRIKDRFPCNVILFPVSVQGEGAAQQVSEAIRFFNDINENSSITKPDILIVARGGGSLEDLWAFNEEIVVRAVAESSIPIISAVGHETDTTLIDFAADRRAPTPTAAAEMATPVKSDLITTILDLKKRSFNGIKRYIENFRRVVDALSKGLISPKQVLENYEQRLDDLKERINLSINKSIDQKRRDLANIRLNRGLIEKFLADKIKELSLYKPLLESYSYKNVIQRGYSVLRLSDGSIARSVSQLSAGTVFELELSDGKKNAAILDGGKPVKPTKNQAPAGQKKQKSETTQNSLF
ncbi:MAG TPA: exodeoxyribonuclease VII large subunit [Alphaproteobacteria bacterium]|nr:exodeoxyribonuclease VII large subunit [Alphaproteobacteria bacterium]